MSHSKPIALAFLLFTSNLCATQALAQASTPEAKTTALSINLHPEIKGPIIQRDIFGQFVEHLGEGVYGGIWVGKNSKIPNVRGIRSDVVQALQALKVPNVRWPGGCFADEYHWRNGIGPSKRRPKTLNGNWGNVVESNTFGTHEFMDFIEQIGSEAYISVNLASGSVEEAASWFEYMTTDQPTSLGEARIANGHPAPYRIKYLGIGNESWGCGGAMSAQSYIEKLKTYSQFVRNFNPVQATDPLVRSPQVMQRIAVGPDAGDTEYTEAVMQAWKSRKPWYWGFEGISLHSYTWGGNPKNAPATGFGEKEYAWMLKETMRMDELINKHSAIMDKYDSRKQVALVIDEWGAWLKVMDGTNPNFLKQQNSLRDAIVASLNLNIFVRHADRVRATNIAQMVNVLQAMILTDGKKILLTPTYYIYRMYLPFQDAQVIPVTFDAGEYTFGNIKLPQVDAIAARAKDGKIWLALTNIDPKKFAELNLDIDGKTPDSAIGEVLTAPKVDSINTFETPSTVAPQPFKANIPEGKLSLTGTRFRYRFTTPRDLTNAFSEIRTS